MDHVSEDEWQRGRPPLYAVLFDIAAVDEAYRPTIAHPQDANSGVTVPHGLDREVASALPGLWYCLHLPNASSSLVDIPAPVLSAAQALDLDHHILLAPVAMFEPDAVGHWLAPGLPMLAVCPDERLDEVARRAQLLGFALPPIAYSQLSDDSLREHWRTVHAALDPDAEYLGREPQLTHRLDLAPTDLPRRWLARQLTDEPPSPADDADDRGDLVASALDEQSLLAAITSFEREGANPQEAEHRMSEALARARRELRIPVALALPGVSQVYARRAYTPALRQRIEPLPAADGADTYALDIDARSDALVERAAIEFVTTHRALARSGLGLMLPSLPPEAFGILAQLEQHFGGPTQRGSSVWRLLDRLDAVTEHLWTNELIALAVRAAPLTAFTNFPIGLLRLPGDTSPLCTRVPIAYQPLLPLTRTVQAELNHVWPVDISDRLRVLVAECIPAEDRVGAASRAGWQAAVRLEANEPRITLATAETLSVEALRSAIDEHRPDILVISVHGAFGPGHTAAGLQIGTKTVLGGLGPLPPVVLLSACSVAPRGASTISITDLLLREGAVAVLGAQVPVRVDRNAILMVRFLVYIAEVLAGREQHPTLLDIWQRVQASNAINDAVSGNRHLHAWATSTAATGEPAIIEFMTVRSAGQLRAGHIYADTERVLGEIAEDRGEGAQVRNWLKNPGYVPESLFYVFAGRPDRVFVRSLPDLVDAQAH
jgi:hypothetical protein